MKKIDAEDALAKSADVVAANVDQLKVLFPEAVKEGKIDFDVLKQLLGGTVDEREERYGLNWHGKRRARQLALTPSTGTLRPCPEESVDWDTTQNLMIEGDNLEVLKLLQKSYGRGGGQIKVIYIDPPYNTGKDFVYPDDFRDNIRNYLELTGQMAADRRVSSNTEASGRFHTDWLNSLYPRIKVAASLLRSDGVLLISIDDKEEANLRLLCDDVFGPENFIATLVWEKGRKNDAKLFSSGHEYMLIYAKSLSTLRDKRSVWREEKPGAREIWDKYTELRSTHGGNDKAIEADLQAWYSDLPKTHPSKKWSRYKRVDRNGPWRDRDISWPGGGGPTYDVIHPVTGKPCAVPEAGWRFTDPQEMQRQIKLGLVEFRADHTEPPFRKAHIKPVPDELDDTADEDGGEEDTESEEEFATQVRGTYFYKQSQPAVKMLRALMGKVFNNPKDHEELAKLIDYVTSSDPTAKILDFYAGSGTTGHSVMELNARDGGNRQYILVQLPEPLSSTKKEQKAAAAFCEKLKRPANIAELTKERLRRSALKVKESSPSAPCDLGFRVFKLDSSNIRAWDPRRDDIAGTLDESVEHLKTDRTEKDILTELLLKLGLELTVPTEEKKIAGKTVYNIGAGTLMACLDTKIAAKDVEKLAHGIADWHKELAPAGETVVVFRDSAFADDVAKTNLTAILAQAREDRPMIVRSL